MARVHHFDSVLPIPRGNRVTIYLLKKAPNREEGERLPNSCRVIVDHTMGVTYGSEAWAETSMDAAAVRDPIANLKSRQWEIVSTTEGPLEASFVDGGNGTFHTVLVVGEGDDVAPYR